MTCREEILSCIREIVATTGQEEVAIMEVIDCMRSRGTHYPESTIRTHIASRMCANAPDHHAVTYDDLERTGRGLYRLRQ